MRLELPDISAELFSVDIQVKETEKGSTCGEGVEQHTSGGGGVAEIQHMLFLCIPITIKYKA